jgi:hypothetical protein
VVAPDPGLGRIRSATKKSPLPGGGGSGLDSKTTRGGGAPPFNVGIASGRSKWPTLGIIPFAWDIAMHNFHIALRKNPFDFLAEIELARQFNAKSHKFCYGT